ncbi:TetR/AcrR family transcriptional regulator [Rhodococcus sp. NPDC003348]
MVRQQKRSPRPLTPERIIEAALAICNTEADLDRLTVRRLAAELGVGVMTLYGYFRSKDEILDAMADHVLGRMTLPDEPDEDPAEAIRTVGRSFLSTMRDQPAVVRLFATRVTDSQTALRGAMEAVLKRLVDAGVPGSIAVRCYGFLITYAIGFASYQAPRQWGQSTAEDADEQRRQRRHYYAGLPIEEFPLVVEYAGEVVDLASDAQFDAGLEAFIDSTIREIERVAPH